jgi:hypothetical protein
VDRLRAHGFTFEVERADTDDDIAAARANTSIDVSSATNRRS